MTRKVESVCDFFSLYLYGFLDSGNDSDIHIRFKVVRPQERHREETCSPRDAIEQRLLVREDEDIFFLI